MLEIGGREGARAPVPHSWRRQWLSHMGHRRTGSATRKIKDKMAASDLHDVMFLCLVKRSGVLYVEEHRKDSYAMLMTTMNDYDVRS